MNKDFLIFFLVLFTNCGVKVAPSPALEAPPQKFQTETLRRQQTDAILSATPTPTPTPPFETQP